MMKKMISHMELPCGSGDHTWTYTEYVGDYIREQIQEDAWNMGCYDLNATILRIV